MAKISSEAEFWQRLENLCKKAASDGAKAIVFPEYFSLSLMMFQNAGKSFRESLYGSRSHSEGVKERARGLVRTLGLAINLGTLPWFEAGKLLNRSWMLMPDGREIFQDKIFMTRFENEQWSVHAGAREIKVFDLGGFKTAILTCYDSEFANLSQVVGAAGVELLLVPSCTDAEHGYWRVRHCCEARTVENQLFVVMASIVGGDPRFPEIDAHHGQGAIFSPCDAQFPPNGLLAAGTVNQEGLCVTDLNLSDLREVRRNGSVLNLRDQKVPLSEFRVECQ